MTGTVIRCGRAQIGYQRPLLGPLDMALPPGARWAITGPNGAGKTLLLNALAGRARLHAGTIRKATGVPLALLAQDHPRPQPWPLCGYDWFRAAGTCPPSSAFVHDLLAQRLDRLSGGQWQLLLLAAMVAPVAANDNAARIILLDEPANHPDAGVRGEAARLIRDLPATATLVVTSHDETFLDALGVRRQPLSRFLDDD